MVAEVRPEPGCWIAGGMQSLRYLDPNSPPYVGPGGQFGGVHRGGAYAAFADGSVRFVANDADPRVFEAMATINGGD